MLKIHFLSIFDLFIPYNKSSDIKEGGGVEVKGKGFHPAMTQSDSEKEMCCQSFVLVLACVLDHHHSILDNFALEKHRYQGPTEGEVWLIRH